MRQGAVDGFMVSLDGGPMDISRISFASLKMPLRVWIVEGRHAVNLTGGWKTAAFENNLEGAPAFSCQTSVVAPFWKVFDPKTWTDSIGFSTGFHESQGRQSESQEIGMK